jgi:ferredoxin-NADP reductase
VKLDEVTGDIMVSLQPKPTSEESTVQQGRNDSEDSNSAQKKYYDEEERKANKISLKLLSKQSLRETDIMTFRLSRVGINYTAGQYAFFKLDGVSGDPKGPIRHFSIASSPTEQDLLISTRIRDSPYKQKLASIEVGTNISVWGPEGEFILHDDHSKPAIFMSGGIGVTPFRSMIKSATDKKLPLKITMFDSNKSPQSILYKDEFDSWATQNQNLKIIYTVTEEEKEAPSGWNGERGRINRSMLEKHVSKNEINNAIFYICGPPGMLKAMQELLQKDLQIPKDRLRAEAFTGY